MRFRGIAEQILTYYDVSIKRITDKCILFVCPFHEGVGNEHNAVLYTDTGFFKCLNESCSKSGRLIEFIRSINDVSWKEAKEIALELFKYDTSEEFLMEDEYTVKKYKTYPLPNSYRRIDKVTDYMTKHNFPLWVFDLFKIGQNGFSDSLILPYIESGNVVGYATKPYEGHVLFPEGFPSKNYLYGGDYASSFNEVFLVEGQRDAWRLIQYNLPTVALSGCSISPRQLTAILKQWNKVTICLDGDAAGRAGAEKIGKELRGLVDLYIVELPDTLDPEQVDDPRLITMCTREYLG